MEDKFNNIKMDKYKYYTYILVFLVLLLALFDFPAEKQTQVYFWSLTETLTFEKVFSNLEDLRQKTYNFLDEYHKGFIQKIEKESGLSLIFFWVLWLLTLIFGYISQTALVFYPTLLLLLFMFFTSRFFKKRKFYNDYYGS